MHRIKGSVPYHAPGYTFRQYGSLLDFLFAIGPELITLQVPSAPAALRV
jgi:hypothetical protein